MICWCIKFRDSAIWYETIRDTKADSIRRAVEEWHGVKSWKQFKREGYRVVKIRIELKPNNNPECKCWDWKYFTGIFDYMAFGISQMDGKTIMDYTTRSALWFCYLSRCPWCGGKITKQERSKLQRRLREKGC